MKVFWFASVSVDMETNLLILFKAGLFRILLSKKNTLVVRFASFVSFSPPMYIGSTMLFILNSLRLHLLSYASCFDIIDSPFCTKADETYYYLSFLLWMSEAEMAVQ